MFISYSSSNISGHVLIGSSFQQLDTAGPTVFEQSGCEGSRGSFHDG